MAETCDSDALAREIVRVLREQLATPAKGCDPYCPSCVRHRQVRRDIQIIQRLAGISPGGQSTKESA